MKEKCLFDKKYRWLVILLVLGAVIVNVKKIFTDFMIDSEYAVALSYRLARGDEMFTQMWEPHQTSAFLGAFFVKLFMFFTESTAGLVIYLHTIGLAIKGGVTFLLYKTLKNHISKEALFFMCLLFFIMNPKEILLPEFSNMQIWFEVMLFCCLVVYFRDQNKKRWLLLAAAALCFQIISYPSCLAVYIGIMFLLWLYSENKGKDMFLFSAVCFTAGCAYILYFAVKIGGFQLLECIRHIAASDASHNITAAAKAAAYGREAVFAVLFLSAFLAAAAFLTCLCAAVCKFSRRITWKINKKKWCIVIFFVLLCIYDFINALRTSTSYNHLIIYIPAVLLAASAQKLCSNTEKRIVNTGFILGITGFSASLILTNLDFIVTLNYFIFAVIVSFIPIQKLCEKNFAKSIIYIRYGVLIIFFGVTLFRNVFVTRPINLYADNILNLGGIVKNGPASGIVSDYMGAYIINCSYEEWKNFVRPGDRILLVGQDRVSTIGYLYGDTEISITSTISTPTYDESLLDYWERNPEKYPNVVIVDCWYGSLNVSQDSWIMQWLEDDFHPASYSDGQYWRYYRAE